MDSERQLNATHTGIVAVENQLGSTGKLPKLSKKQLAKASQAAPDDKFFNIEMRVVETKHRRNTSNGKP